MFQEERTKAILEYLEQEKRAKVGDLSKKFLVSKVTIRKDLDILEKEGVIIKTHGGALHVSEKLSYEIPYKLKSKKNINEKQKIGRVAANLIEDNDIIILDSGSTTIEIAKRIKQNNITVITNDINIALEVANKGNIELIVSGGILIKGVYTLIGDNSLDFFKKIHVNKTFLGCDAIDLKFGISNRQLNECNIKNAIIQSAIEVIAVFDSSKFGKKVSFHLCDINNIHKIVTNSIESQYLSYFKEKKIEVLIAN